MSDVLLDAAVAAWLEAAPTTWRTFWRCSGRPVPPVDPRQRYTGTAMQLAHAVGIGERRRDWAIDAGYGQPMRSTDPNGTGPDANIIGAIGESMFAGWGGVPWRPNVGGSDKLTGDVDGWEVRTSQRADSSLFIRPTDPEDRWIVLVTSAPDPPHFVIRGAIPIWVARATREWEWRHPRYESMQWRVPQRALTMAELYAWKAIKALRHG